MPIHFTGHVVLYRYQHTQTDRKGKIMRIILDDRRPMPEKGPYNCVRTYEDCTYLLRNISSVLLAWIMTCQGVRRGMTC